MKKMYYRGIDWVHNKSLHNEWSCKDQKEYNEGRLSTINFETCAECPLETMCMELTENDLDEAYEKICKIKAILK